MPAQIPAKTSGSLGEALTNTRTAVTNELSAVHLERLKSLAIEISTEIGETAAPAPGSILDRLDDLEAGGGGVPDPSAEDDGQILTVASGAAVWANPPSGSVPSTAGQNPGNVLTIDGAENAAWAAPAAGAADTILSVTSTDGDTNALVTPQNDGVSLSLVGAGSDGAGGIAGPAVLQGGRGFSAANGGDVYVQGGTVAGGGFQGVVRLGDVSGSSVSLGREGIAVNVVDEFQITNDGTDVRLEHTGGGAIEFLSPVRGLGINNLRTLTTSGTIATSDRVLNCNAASGNQTHALPNPATMDPGQCILIKKISTGANTISLSRFAAENIEGTSATFLLPGSAGTGRPAWTLYTDGTDWFVA